jgi:dCMP deaminase
VSRPSFEEWALALAGAVSLRGDCSRRQVGAVMFDPSWRVLAVGYNGVRPGELGCLAGGCPRASSGVAPGSSYDTGPGSCVASHAEANALLYSDPVRRQGGTVAVSEQPCDGCLKLVRASGVARVIYPGGEIQL